MRQLYTLGIRLYSAGIRVAAHFGHQKARQMTRGWRTWRQAVEGIDPERPTAWFHASSLGEFEQARPVLEAYRSAHPDHQVMVTFFSPSGYEVRKNYPLADAICYLPPDTPKNVRALLDATRPDIAFFVKYDFWYNYLGELRRRNVATYLFSSIFRPGQYFFKPWGKWFLGQLGLCYRHIFVQNTESRQLLKSHHIDRVSVAGDTRFDRVHQIALAAEPDAVVERFVAGGRKVLVCGSTWPPDEQLLAHVRTTSTKWFPDRIIIAPHLIDEGHLKQIESLFPDSVRYSRFDSNVPGDMHTLIIDNIGLLSKLYRYGDVAYIGGGFGVGIHNILEAVTFGRPVVFGPNYRKFQEAKDIIALGGGYSIANEAELADGGFRDILTHPEAYEKASKACTQYMEQNLGSTQTILSTLEK